MNYKLKTLSTDKYCEHFFLLQRSPSKALLVATCPYLFRHCHAGVLTAGVSAVWSLLSWRQVNHSKYLAVVVVLGLLTTLLEVSDFPPYLWTFDAHALWHLSTVPMPYFFWRLVKQTFTVIWFQLNSPKVL